MPAWRLFPSRLSPEERRVYGAVTVYFALVFLALLWPIYPLFAAARPLILGLPLSLFYLSTILMVSFGVLVALLVWETRSGRLDSETDL